MFARQFASFLLLPLLAVGGQTFSQVLRQEGPRLGTWELIGKDKRDWKAVLVINKRAQTTFEGYVKWQALSGEPSSGHEPFQGIFNPTTGVITWKGLDMRDKQGSIAIGSIYEATVSDGGYSLRDGRWFGPNVAPGTWSAVWKNANTPKP